MPELKVEEDKKIATKFTLPIRLKSCFCIDITDPAFNLKPASFDESAKYYNFKIKIQDSWSTR